MLRFALAAPWETFQKMLVALFANDDEITISDIYEPDVGDETYAIDIGVNNTEKYHALERMLPRIKTYGNVTVQLNVYDSTNDDEDTLEVFKAIFQGNHIVKDFKTAVDPSGVPHYYLRFWPEVVQFFDDDISDYNGNWSGLAQDIAREVFENPNGMNFCTAPVNENDVEPPEEAKTEN